VSPYISHISTGVGLITAGDILFPDRDATDNLTALTQRRLQQIHGSEKSDGFLLVVSISYNPVGLLLPLSHKPINSALSFILADL
jgi:hypothetical protein